MKYFVIALHWDDEKQAQVNYIAGEFPKYYLAAIFRDAYNKQFSTNAKVIEASEFINK